MIYMARVSEKQEYVKQVNSMVSYQEDIIVSKVLTEKETGSITMFSFDKGQGVSEQFLPYNSVLFITDGQAEIIINNDDKKVITKDEIIYIPKFTSHEIFQSLHGVDISQDGETIFVSGRADGHLHIIDTETGELQNSLPLSTNPSMVMAGGVATVKNLTSLLGDVNNDAVLDILDIVLIVNYILGSGDIQPNTADMNDDGIIDILDIVNLVNIILR